MHYGQPSPVYRSSLGSPESARRLPSVTSHNSSDLTYGDSRQLHPSYPETSYLNRSGVRNGSFVSPVSQTPYHIGHIDNSGRLDTYMQNSSPSPPLSQVSAVSGDSWHSSEPSPAAIRDPSPGHYAYSGVSATSYPTTYSREQYQPQPDYGSYTSSVYHNQTVTPSAPGNATSAFPDGSGYSSIPQSTAFGYPAQSAYTSRPRATSAPRCEWGTCRHIIEDSTPSGIARHLRQYHGVQVTDNRSRHPCIWGSRRCGKDMYPSSFGKHIAECHLRNMRMNARAAASSIGPEASRLVCLAWFS
ncbi:hypothetical protein ONZ51_g5339 [Trametes cubensis]|uniref:Uncharacterized protein n=1 Tax=Trametes cubensis TaxID=1111947 RepID=A0AAD7TWM8_9APHY|nr:hypothetical protein ONZ51_g5339 [Trametes cubensis]